MYKMVINIRTEADKRYIPVGHRRKKYRIIPDEIRSKILE